MTTPFKKRLPRDFFDDALPFKIDGDYCKLIPLTRGQFSIVNLEDYDHLSERSWCAVQNEKSGHFYAHRGQRENGMFFGVIMHRVILGLKREDGYEVDHKEMSKGKV